MEYAEIFFTFDAVAERVRNGEFQLHSTIIIARPGTHAKIVFEGGFYGFRSYLFCP
jgi:hypothetical protein